MWLAMKSLEPGVTDREIAGRLGISSGYMKQLLYHARRDGWLHFEDPLHKIEYDIIPKVVDNLSYFLGKKDKTVTVETAKGVLFPQYKELKGISDAPQTILALKIEAADPTAEVRVITGQIVGQPRQLEE